MTKNPVKRFLDLWESVKKTEFGSWQIFLSSSVMTWFLLFLLAVVATLLSTISLQRMPSNLKEGMLAAYNIKADRNYEIVDEEATQKFKNEAAEGVLPVYDFDDRAADAVIKRIHEAFLGVREKYSEDSGALENFFSDKLGIAFTPEQWNVLVSERFSERAEAVVAGLVRKAMTRPVIAERGSLDAGKNKSIIIRKLKTEGTAGQEPQFEEKNVDDLNQIISTDEVRQKIGEIAVSTSGFKNPGTPAALTALAESLIEPNCSLNRTETEKRRDAASQNVKNVILKVNAGSTIIRGGSRYELWHIKVLRGIQKEKRRGMYSMEFLGTFLLIALFIIIPFYLAKKFFRRVKVSRADYLFMSVTGLSVLAIMRFSFAIDPAIHDALFFSVPSSLINYTIPVASGAMLLRMFLGAEITFVFAIVLSAIAGFFVETDIKFISFCLVSNFTAIIAISNADRRSLIIRAGVITGVVSILVMLGIRLIGIASASEPFTIFDVLWGILFALIGGIGSSIFTMIAASIVESVSGYTSDIKLLELANLNHPLLRELIVRAPGTYHHSHMVGILGEAAAGAIGANALLVRVGAYYHDIGKMKKPQYFIENAKTGENKHERLSPHMSALIVSAHVKDGVDMAKAAGIPKSIMEMIPEHHGTRIISYFYEKAKEQADPTVQKVDIGEFAYPGPKPQTREAAILMLADATEAAVRSLKEKSTTRIQQTVQRVITDIFMEKQLDECELTLKDLNEIARAFVRILLGIYHARIEYPKDAEHDKLEVSIVDES